MNSVITLVITRSCCSTISCPTQMTGPSNVTSVNTPHLKKTSWSPIWPSNTQVSVEEGPPPCLSKLSMYSCFCHVCTPFSTMCPLQGRNRSPAICATSPLSTGRIYDYTCSVATLRHLSSGLFPTLKNLQGNDAGLSSPCSRLRSSNNNMIVLQGCQVLL